MKDGCCCLTLWWYIRWTKIRLFRVATAPLVSCRTGPRSPRTSSSRGSAAALRAWIPSQRNSSVPFFTTISNYIDCRTPSGMGSPIGRLQGQYSSTSRVILTQFGTPVLYMSLSDARSHGTLNKVVPCWSVLPCLSWCIQLLGADLFIVYTAVHTSYRNAAFVHCRLQRAVDGLAVWASRWGLAIKKRSVWRFVLHASTWGPQSPLEPARKVLKRFT